MEKKSLKAVSSNTKSDEKSKKLTYEELEQACNNLHTNCRRLAQQLQEAERVIANLNDVGILLSILSHSDYFSTNFIGKCVSRIEGTVGGMLDAVVAKEAESEISSN